MFYIINQVLWIVSSLMIFLCGIYFSFKLKFIHLNFKRMIQAVMEKSEKGISSFQSLSMSLAGRIGVGSLSGIALAVYLGGPGTLFWIWITSLLCSSTTFVESSLAVIFRRKDLNNIYRGGPFYYIDDGLGNKHLAFTYAVIVLISYVGGFLTLQVNTVSRCTYDLFHIPTIITGIAIALLTCITIFGGVKKIALTTSKLVPIMTVFYLSICTYIIVSKINLVPQVFIDILNSALNFKSFGIGTISTLLIGMQKGIFSSEVGLGTGAIVAVTADTSNPASSGLAQTLGIHIENLLIATITVFVICMTNYQSLNLVDPNGIEIALFAFKEHIGSIGPLFITITIILFGLSTVIAGYYYGESSLKYIKKTSNIDIFLLKILNLIIIVVRKCYP